MITPYQINIKYSISQISRIPSSIYNVLIKMISLENIPHWRIFILSLIYYRDIKASGIYVVLYKAMSGDTGNTLSPLRIVIAGGLAG